MRFDLHERQSMCFSSRATEILYGGAAGGGKSHLLRVVAIVFALLIPGLQVYLFRRESPDLIKNHMDGPTSFPVMLSEYVQRKYVSIVYSPQPKIKFWNGSVIHLCHCQYEKDMFAYQGAEIHLLLIDELTHFTKKIYAYLRGRCRVTSLKIPAELRGLFPRIIGGSNPGGVGHAWVKGDFIDGAAPMEIRRMPPEEGGMMRQFIPAKLSDNPTLLESDPDYEHRLSGLGSPELVRAMKEGDWDITMGGMLDDVWKRDAHALHPFRIPEGWKVDRSFDWGSAKPFSVIWWAESDGTPATLDKGVQKHFPPGTLFAVAEWYGARNKSNEGLRLTAKAIAEGIKEREAALTAKGALLAGRDIMPGPADNAIFDAGGPDNKSVAGEMRLDGVLWSRSDKSAGSRVAGWERIRMMLEAATREPMEDPGLFVFSTCRDWIRTVPVLPRDTNKTDDVDTHSEDHAGDATRYRVHNPTVGRDLE